PKRTERHRWQGGLSLEVQIQEKTCSHTRLRRYRGKHSGRWGQEGGLGGERTIAPSPIRHNRFFSEHYEAHTHGVQGNRVQSRQQCSNTLDPESSNRCTSRWVLQLHSPPEAIATNEERRSTKYQSP
ncbi:unnamed protein product, partial [Ectocarpus sp. 13 AM-2016]